MRIVEKPEELANGMWSKGLITNAVKDDVNDFAAKKLKDKHVSSSMIVPYLLFIIAAVTSVVLLYMETSYST